VAIASDDRDAITDDISFGEFQCSLSSKTDLPTRIKPIVAILTGLVTPEPVNFRTAVPRLLRGCDRWNTERHRQNC
jgi:hypothetical protein